MFKQHKHQNLIFILCGAGLFVMMIGIGLETYAGIDRIVVLFVLLGLTLIAAIVIGIILISKHVKRKRMIKKHNFSDYHKYLNRRK